MAQIIDAHHHLWRYNSHEYAWISPEMAVLHADFLPGLFEEEMRSAGIHCSVLMQTRQTIEETTWMLDLAGASTAIAGVVGWLPLDSPEISALLQPFSSRTKLKGLRHIVQDEPELLLSPAFNEGIAALTHAGLVYDIVVHAPQLPIAVEFVKKHPRQSFVLDHCGKPEIGSGSFATWRDDLLRLADHENVACKISGLATQAPNANWTLDDLRPYLDVVFEAFGPTRLMAGSDWPVCLLASSYTKWWSALREWSSTFDDSARDDIFSATAKRIYRLDP
jgi:L-fuconolactonase